MMDDEGRRNGRAFIATGEGRNGRGVDKTTAWTRERHPGTRPLTALHAVKATVTYFGWLVRSPTRGSRLRAPAWTVVFVFPSSP
jgi:hypothetical protein